MKGEKMSLVIDTLRTSMITEELTDSELKILVELVVVKDRKAGEQVVMPRDKHPDNLYILAQGEVEVKIKSSDGETVIDKLKPGDLAGVITFVGGAPTQHSATLYSIGNSKVLRLERSKFVALVDTHPMIVYKVMCAIVRNVHGIVRNMNARASELSNYIYRHSGGY